MKKTIKLYSVKVDKEIIDELTLIAYRYSKVKNYIYQNYGSINGLTYVDKPNNLRDEWVKSGFANQWKLSARYWKMALSEAFSNIKTTLSQTKTKIKDYIKRNIINKQEAHYIRYILKSDKNLYKILTNQQVEIKKEFNVDKNKLHKLLKRLYRKYNPKSLSKQYKSFMVDSAMYQVKNGLLEIASLTPRKRLKIKLTSNITKTKGNVRVVIDRYKNRIEIHYAINIKTKANNNSAIIGIDKGFKKLIATSNNRFYGENLSELLIKHSEKLNNKNKQRNKLNALKRKYIEKSKTNPKYTKKLKNLYKFNLSKQKYYNRKNTTKENITKYINQSINNFINHEKPKVVVMEDLTFVTKNKHKLPKKVNRWLSSWLKGYIQNRLEYKLSVNQTELVNVNPAYTSQICSNCQSFGKRRGERFYCKVCGGVDADYNASVNILNRFYDDKITLYTPYKKVKQILLLRMSDREKSRTVPSKT